MRRRCSEIRLNDHNINKPFIVRYFYEFLLMKYKKKFPLDFQKFCAHQLTVLFINFHDNSDKSCEI